MLMVYGLWFFLAAVSCYSTVICCEFSTLFQSKFDLHHVLNQRESLSLQLEAPRSCQKIVQHVNKTDIP